MRAVRIGVVGVGALLAGCIAVACSNSSSEGGDDAGSLDAYFTQEDAGTPDGAAISFGRDGGDASAPPGTDASGPPSDDASDSTASGEGGGTDASHAADASDASDAAETGIDASDAAQTVVDASDGGLPGVDAGDAGAVEDAGDDSATVDAASADAGTDDASEDAGQDAADDASDGAVACVSCGTTVSYLGGAAGFVSSTGSPVTLTGGGTIPDGDTLSVVVQTYPKGSATVHVVYATSSLFAGATDVVLTYDTNQPAPNNDQWYAILPAQSAGTTVYFYLYAAGCDCTTILYDPGNSQNFTYTEN